MWAGRGGGVADLAVALAGPGPSHVICHARRLVDAEWSYRYNDQVLARSGSPYIRGKTHTASLSRF
jgi:hypothetical protein